MDIISYALSKKYTKESLEGMGALKGKNCIISSIEPTENGNVITFSWVLDDGTQKTDSLFVMNGEEGTSIISMYIDENNHLIAILSDSTQLDAGEVPTLSDDVEIIIQEEVSKQIDSQLEETIQDSVNKAVDEALAGSSGSETNDEIDSWF